MRVCLLTSTSRRHAYMAHRLAEKVDLGLVIQEDKGLDDFYRGHRDEALIADHFARLKKTEDSFFADFDWNSLSVKRVTVPRGGMNSSETAEIISAAAPQAAIVFGSGILKGEVMRALPVERAFNLHQGLSPYYRGSGTNFWPYVEGRPHYIGATVHLIDENIDTGAIVAHTRPLMEPSDTLHTLGCKTVAATADCILDVLQQLERGSVPAVTPQWEKGKLYRRSDMTGAAVLDARAKDESHFIAQFLDSNALAENIELVGVSA